jgi:di/tricarboxylate transporter
MFDSSYAFMLPVATPPNAIVFSAAKMNPVEMVNIHYRTFKQIHKATIS